MYTVSKGPSKIVAKTRRGISQNYEKFETIKESGKRSSDYYSPEKNNVPRPVFQTIKKPASNTKQEEEVITPQHEEIIKYINDSWNIIVAHNPYDETTASNVKAAPASSADANNNTAAPFLPPRSTNSSPASQQTSASFYCVEPPSPVLSEFKPFDLESWWGRRLFNNITKSL